VFGEVGYDVETLLVGEQTPKQVRREDPAADVVPIAGHVPRKLAGHGRRDAFSRLEAPRRRLDPRERLCPRRIGRLELERQVVRDRDLVQHASCPGRITEPVEERQRPPVMRDCLLVCVDGAGSGAGIQ
jgi:hypothetical protein